MSDNSSNNKGIGLFKLLLLIFITLKLTGKINWSWIWVLSPFWVPIVFVMIFFITLAIIGTCG